MHKTKEQLYDLIKDIKTKDEFKKDGGKATAKLMSAPFLGTIPFHQDVVKASDEGQPVMSRQGDSEFHRAFEAIVYKIID